MLEVVWKEVLMKIIVRTKNLFLKKMKVKARENTYQLPRLLILSKFGDLTIILSDFSDLTILLSD